MKVFLLLASLVALLASASHTANVAGVCDGLSSAGYTTAAPFTDVLQLNDGVQDAKTMVHMHGTQSVADGKYFYLDGTRAELWSDTNNARFASADIAQQEVDARSMQCVDGDVEPVAHAASSLYQHIWDVIKVPSYGQSASHVYMCLSDIELAALHADAANDGMKSGVVRLDSTWWHTRSCDGSCAQHQLYFHLASLSSTAAASYSTSPALSASLNTASFTCDGRQVKSINTAGDGFDYTAASSLFSSGNLVLLSIESARIRLPAHDFAFTVPTSDEITTTHSGGVLSTVTVADGQFSRARTELRIVVGYSNRPTLERDPGTGRVATMDTSVEFTVRWGLEDWLAASTYASNELVASQSFFTRRNTWSSITVHQVDEEADWTPFQPEYASVITLPSSEAFSSTNLHWRRDGLAPRFGARQNRRIESSTSVDWSTPVASWKQISDASTIEFTDLVPTRRYHAYLSDGVTYGRGFSWQLVWGQYAAEDDVPEPGTFEKTPELVVSTSANTAGTSTQSCLITDPYRSGFFDTPGLGITVSMNKAESFQTANKDIVFFMHKDSTAGSRLPVASQLSRRYILGAYHLIDGRQHLKLDGTNAKWLSDDSFVLPTICPIKVAVYDLSSGGLDLSAPTNEAWIDCPVSSDQRTSSLLASEAQCTLMDALERRVGRVGSDIKRQCPSWGWPIGAPDTDENDSPDACIAG